jgi:hypothetical protein
MENTGVFSNWEKAENSIGKCWKILENTGDTLTNSMEFSVRIGLLRVQILNSESSCTFGLYTL